MLLGSFITHPQAISKKEGGKNQFDWEHNEKEEELRLETELGLETKTLF